MHGSADTTIRQAIIQRQQLDITYGGYQRKIEAYIYGVLKNGNICFRAFQHSGGSKSGECRQEWKIFDLDKISLISLGGERFSVIQSRYNPNDKAFKQVYARV